MGEVPKAKFLYIFCLLPSFPVLTLHPLYRPYNEKRNERNDKEGTSLAGAPREIKIIFQYNRIQPHGYSMIAERTSENQWH